MPQFSIPRFFRLLILGLAIALSFNALATILTPTPVSAQFEPTFPLSLPAATTTPIELTELALSEELGAFVPPGLPQSDDPASGERGIIGPDDRIPMTSSDYPWSAIGRIISQVSKDDTTMVYSACTGTLIDAAIVLTNAHCVLNPSTHQYYPAIYFQPNLVNGQLQDEADLAIATHVWAATDFQDDTIAPNPNDWALIELDRPLGDTYGTLAWHPLPLDTLVQDYQRKLTLVGYSGDFPADNPGQTAGVHEECSIFWDYQGSFVHDCDSTGGSSGGPLLAEVDGEIRIVALNSAERVEVQPQVESPESQRTGILNYAVQIPRIVEALIALQS